jgi:hypothetical protein
MLILRASAVVCALSLVAVGCGSKKEFDGPTVDAFVGRVVQDGKPVTLPPDSGTQLNLIFEAKAESFLIPLQTDGTFKIGWMPIGKYTALVEKPGKGGRAGPPIKYRVPGGLTIEEGKTEYTIELGKDWKP